MRRMKWTEINGQNIWKAEVGEAHVGTVRYFPHGDRYCWFAKYKINDIDTNGVRVTLDEAKAEVEFNAKAAQLYNQITGKPADEVDL